MVAPSSIAFWRSLGSLYDLVQPGRRRDVWVLVLLTVAGAISEVVAIGSVVPFLALLSETSTSHRVSWMTTIFGALGAGTRGQQLLVATALLCAAAIAAGVLRVLLARMTQSFAFFSGHRLSVEIQRRMLLQPYSWHVGHNSSDQLATIEKVEIVTTSVLLPLIQALAAMVLVVVVVAVLLQIAPFATIAAGIALGTAYYVLGALARRRLLRNSQQVDSAFERRIRILQEGLGGIRDIILDGSQSTVLEQFRSTDFELAQARANSTFVAAIPRYLIESAGIIVIAALALFLSKREGGFVAALPVLGALALGAQRLLPLVQQLYQGWSNVAANKAVINDVVQRIQLSVAPASPPLPRLPFGAAIEFREVAFIYSGGAAPAVKDLTFNIPHGARIGLVGRTGSGKSTTADLLMGLLRPTDGKIFVDGVALDDNNLQAWRANIAHVPQILFLADATIAQNIAMTADVDLERVREAAQLAHLDKFVATLPDGYDTRVGERGARISGGQRQRLALARAIYKNAPLLVLDEATSALDDDTEAAVAGALDVLQSEGRTIVIIAHRSKLIATCDRLVRLEKGRMVE